MGYNSKNYTEQSGEKTVIGGELAITLEGKITFDGKPLKPAVSQLSSKAVDAEGLVTDFNALLTKLKSSGLMESE